MSQVAELRRPSRQAEAEPLLREVAYEHTRNFAPLLDRLGASLLVSTYQAGKLVAVGSHNGQLQLGFHNFDRAMGLAVRPDRVAVGGRNQVWFLRGVPELAARVEPAGRHDACFLTRAAHFTGDIQGHEMAWAGDELWVVNTLFSCLCTLHPDYSFVPRWRPPFVTALAAEDRCHLNGLALAADERGVSAPRYVTALGETDTCQGWRPGKVGGGCLIDVQSNRVVARGFVMPHSPRVYQGRLWLLDSGRGALVAVDPETGAVTTVAELPGYARGLAFHGPLAFVGLSRVRETSTFGGLPIAERREQLKCGVAVVDLRSGGLAAHLEFRAGVEEIFDVQVLPGVRCPALSGPCAGNGEGQTIWMVPGPSAEGRAP